MSISEMYAEKSRYESFKTSINSAISSAETVINNLLLPAQNIGIAYQKDVYPMDKNYVNNARNNLINKKDALKNTVIPAIDNKINELKGSIAAAERAEAEARKRAEEEAKKKAEEANKSAPKKSTT